MKILNNILEIFKIKTKEQFNEIALQVFRFQAKNNAIYAKYLEYLKTDINNVTKITDIPFLPIEFFKTHKIVSTKNKEQIIFTSSGTTGLSTSKHYVSDLNIYEQSFNSAFKAFYGNPQDYCILGLLPSYLEREGSSLIYMVDSLIKQSNNSQSGFYLNNLDELVKTLQALEHGNEKYILFGVTYALLDLAENHNLKLNNAIIMETGGMKGKRKEISKQEMHKILINKLGVKTIHSEYGMTELLSQAYSIGEGIYKTPAWMKILIRDIYDPFAYVETGKSGGINIIDLANINSCSFIETKDLGKQFADKSFTILGRFDNSDIRGCNLLVQ